MKLTLCAVISFLFILSACRKNNDSSEINGSWKLIEVYDKNTATVNHPPPGSNMDVVITFLNDNKFAGHTLRNSLTDGTFTQNGNEIIFESFSMTKIAEDQWGGSFLTVLHACSLQSMSPCAPSVMSIHGNIMKITTPLRYDITLEKL
jgi:hypothetical protein